MDWQIICLERVQYPVASEQECSRRRHLLRKESKQRNEMEGRRAATATRTWRQIAETSKNALRTHIACS
ncbi:hypothetical protein DV515_00002707 [Chloebia gouldiae]|uniref:Uncharacterized protein n=1 Tax=Chloebia gouldiae TaxID=44316 RepID=A0A3L8SVP4_CHLGU|nr:hypothetical protein DV515_00002707 [Chloebia gouldiae]